MKRTYDANIGGTIFHVEEDAYTRLEAYLESVKTHFRSYPDHVDIVTDIESRIAEQCAQRSAFSRVVTLADVEIIIGVMGSVDQFDDTAAPPLEPGGADTAGHPAADADLPGRRRLFRDPDQMLVAGVAACVARYWGIAPRGIRLALLLPVPLLIFLGTIEFIDVDPQGIVKVALFELFAYVLLWLVIPRKKTSATGASPVGRRRLFRDPDEMLIAGVAAGIARYWGIAPRGIRLALLLPVPFLIFLGITEFVDIDWQEIVKLGIFETAAYLLLWLLIPSAKTSIDKLRMRGHAITLASVAQRVREDDAVPTSRAGAAALITAIGSSLRMLVLGSAWLAGFLLAAWIIVTIIGLTVFLTVVMTNPTIVPVTRELASMTVMGFKFYPFAVCCYLLAVIPLVLIGTVVVTELQKRRGVRWNRPAPSVYITAMAVWMVALIAWAWLWASSIKPV